MKNAIRWVIASGALIWLTDAANALADPHCTGVPADMESPPVTVCESPTGYEFRIAGNSWQYDKTAWQTALVTWIGNWLADAGAGPLTDGAGVEVWMSVPEANPEAAQARAVVRHTSGTFVVFMPVQPDLWDDQSPEVAVLAPGTSYPDSFGHDAGSIILKAIPGTDRGETEALLMRAGALEMKDSSGQWETWLVPAFKEVRTISRLKRDKLYGELLDYADINPMMEWISWRERVFAFSVVSP